MAFQRKGSPLYQIRRRRLVGYGDTGQISSGTANKKLAARMEEALEDLAETALIEPRYRVLLDAVCRDHSVSPAELLASRRDLDTLLVSIDDPRLTEAASDFRRGFSGSHVTELGLAQLLEYTPAGARLSYLTAKTITTLCHTAMEAPEKEGTRHRNTVVRQFKRTVSQLLRFHLGKARRNEIFADVEFTAVNDTRKVHLSPDDIRRLLDACHTCGYPELAVVVQTALLTSADRSVLLAGPSHRGKVTRGLLVGDLRIYADEQGHWGEVHLQDTKTASRTRTVTITGILAHDLLQLAAGKGPSDPVFSISYRDLDYPWKAARSKAGLDGVRFKDLRAQISQYGEEAGIPLTILQGAMGHSDNVMTRRYQQREAIFTRSHADAVLGAMGMPSLQSSLQTDLAASVKSP